MNKTLQRNSNHNSNSARTSCVTRKWNPWTSTWCGTCSPGPSIYLTRIYVISLTLLTRPTSWSFPTTLNSLSFTCGPSSLSSTSCMTPGSFLASSTSSVTSRWWSRSHRWWTRLWPCGFMKSPAGCSLSSLSASRSRETNSVSSSLSASR